MSTFFFGGGWVKVLCWWKGSLAAVGITVRHIHVTRPTLQILGLWLECSPPSFIYTMAMFSAIPEGLVSFRGLEVDFLMPCNVGFEHRTAALGWD